jgi:hypothetical protein
MWRSGKSGMGKSSPPSDDFDPVGAKTQGLGFPGLEHAALTCGLVRGDDLSWNVGVTIGSNYFP